MTASTNKDNRRIMGHRKLRLIRELASGEKTRSSLAKEFEIDSATVTNFAKANADAINACIRSIDDEMAGLWIASQVNRIAEYQELAEKLDEIIFDESSTDTVVSNAILRKTTILRQVAEERGHLMQKVETSGKYNYVVEGVDMTKLGG